MNSPIFKDVNLLMREAMPHYNALKKAEEQMARIVMENKEALLTAWVAEMGLLPSQSAICQQYIDGHWRIWVESKEENDKRERA